MCFALFCALSLAAHADDSILIVADEIPAMQILAGHLKAGAHVTSTIVTQAEMPADLARYPAVAVYIHKTIGEPVEKAFIQYAKAGGKLILLHHSISSGKRKNQFWFPFLGVSLPEKDFSEGGYKWIEPVTISVVNLAPLHYITSHNVKYPAKIPYRSSDLDEDERAYPGYVLEDTEVYLNQVLLTPKNLLLGLKYQDAQSGKIYMQDRAGWIMKTGRGMVIYFMAGHTAKDFENPPYRQILINAVEYKP